MPDKKETRSVPPNSPQMPKESGPLTTDPSFANQTPSSPGESKPNEVKDVRPSKK